MAQAQAQKKGKKVKAKRRPLTGDEHQAIEVLRGLANQIERREKTVFTVTFNRPLSDALMMESWQGSMIPGPYSTITVCIQHPDYLNEARRLFHESITPITPRNRKAKK